MYIIKQSNASKGEKKDVAQIKIAHIDDVNLSEIVLHEK
jgi:hypothetical protein